MISKVDNGTPVPYFGSIRPEDDSDLQDLPSVGNTPASQSLVFVNDTLLRILRMVVGLEKSVEGQEIIELGIPSLVARAATNFSSQAQEALLLGIQVCCMRTSGLTST
jgi:hypothetical protein